MDNLDNNENMGTPDASGDNGQQQYTQPDPNATQYADPNQQYAQQDPNQQYAPPNGQQQYAQQDPNQQYAPPNGQQQAPNYQQQYVDPNAQYQQYQAPIMPPYPPKSKLTAGLLGIFLGSIGVHNFYLGYKGKAIAQLLIAVLTCGIGAAVTSIWGLIEGIMILTGSIAVDGNGYLLVD